MNILFFVGSERDIRVMKNLVNRYPIESLHIIIVDSIVDIYSKSELMELTKTMILYTDSLVGKYENYPYYDDAPPVDILILNQMRKYEAEILKQMDRLTHPREQRYPLEERFMIYFGNIRYWNYFLDAAKIDCFINIGVAPHEVYNYTIMRLCQLKKIPTLYAEYMPFRATHRVAPFNDFEHFDYGIKKEMLQLATSNNIELPEDMEKEFEVFSNANMAIASPLTYGLKSEGTADEAPKPTARIKPSRAGRMLIKLKEHIRRRDFKMSLKRRYIRETSGKELKQFYDKVSVAPDYSQKYIYFPLHYQPEMTTSPSAGDYVHQYLAVELLAKHLPKDVWIFVKIHPLTLTCWGSIGAEQIKRMHQISKVKFITAAADTVILAKHSIAVASMTGTIGYEAMYLKKPYFMFGNQIMKYGPWTYNIKTNEECRDAVQHVMSGNNTESDECCRNKIRAYLAVLAKHSVILDIDLRGDWLNTNRNIENLTTLYCTMLDRELGRLQRNGENERLTIKCQPQKCRDAVD